MNMNMKNEDTTAHELSAAVSDFIDTLCNIADENNKNRDDLINTAGSLLCFLTHTTTFQKNSPKETLMEKHWKECMQIAHYDNELNGNRGWIPCSERMPAHYQHIVFAIVDAKKTYDTFSGVYDALYNKFRSDADWWVDENAVSHWMPLPEPPVERKEGEENE